jgi:hypothetical protein
LTLSSTDQRELEVCGSAVIASSPRNARSHSPLGQRNTAFTGQVVDLLNDGSPNVGEALTVTSLFRRVYFGLVRDGFPQPMLAATGTMGELLLRRSPPPPAPPPIAEPPTIRVPPVPWPVHPPQGPPAQPRFPVASQPVPESKAAVFAQLILVRFVWVWTAVMLTMSGSGLSGSSSETLIRRWRHLRGRTRFSRTTVGRMVLMTSVVVCVVFGIAACFIEGGTAVFFLALEGAAAGGYHLYRGRRAPS